MNPAAVHARGVVLVVDDHDAARYVKVRLLREAGYTVEESDTGLDALDKVYEHRPDVIVLDIRLPGIDGLEVCRRLRADPRTQTIAIIHTSASFVQADDRARGLEHGADAYLTAPIDERVMLATVATMMRARLAESALRESEQRFRTMADAAPVMIWLADSSKRYVWFNRRWLEFTGRDREESARDGLLADIHPDDAANRTAAFERAFEARRAFEVEYRVRTAAGEYHWLVDHGVPLYDGAREFMGFVGSCVDDTDRRAAEEERTRLLASERAARMEAERLNRTKDEFLATLSHELRTPLNAILGWSQLLGQDALEGEELKQGIETIERNARAQARIIEDLLDMSRIIAGKVRLEIQEVSLDKTVEAAIESVRLAATAKEIQLDKHVHELPAHVSGDPDRLQQIVWNLLSNAIKFTPRHGRVSVSVRQVQSSVEIEVRDNGPGIPPEMLPHLFERFWQANASVARPHGGLGLGLAIAKHLVELHGGTISAESPGGGQGATFRVLLPIAMVRAPLEETTYARAERLRVETLHPVQRLSLRGVRVLVVDDDDDGRDLLKRILRENGAEVESAASGEDALVLLERDPPDVLISDIGMPGLDGYALMRRVRALSRERGGCVPAVALTAFARNDDRRQAVEAGYQAHLAKPVEVSELVTLITQLAPHAHLETRADVLPHPA